MKKRPDGFLSEENINHNCEIFNYIQELHEYLWKFIRLQLPYSSGNIDSFIDEAIEIMEAKNYG